MDTSFLGGYFSRKSPLSPGESQFPSSLGENLKSDCFEISNGTPPLNKLNDLRCYSSP